MRITVPMLRKAIRANKSTYDLTLCELNTLGEHGIMALSPFAFLFTFKYDDWYPYHSDVIKFVQKTFGERYSLGFEYGFDGTDESSEKIRNYKLFKLGFADGQRARKLLEKNYVIFDEDKYPIV